MPIVRLNAANMVPVDDSESGALSEMDGASTTGSTRSFQMNGQTYTLRAGERKSVPEIVATSWNSADSDVEILWDGFD